MMKGLLPIKGAALKTTFPQKLQDHISNKLPEISNRALEFCKNKSNSKIIVLCSPIVQLLSGDRVCFSPFLQEAKPLLLENEGLEAGRKAIDR